MLTGMLWFCDDPKMSLGDQIRKAVAYYKNKYKHMPDLCMVNPKDKPNEMDSVLILGAGESITIHTYKGILPRHLWIGVDNMTLVPMSMILTESEVQNELGK